MSTSVLVWQVPCLLCTIGQAESSLNPSFLILSAACSAEVIGSTSVISLGSPYPTVEGLSSRIQVTENSRLNT